MATRRVKGLGSTAREEVAGLLIRVLLRQSHSRFRKRNNILNPLKSPTAPLSLAMLLLIMPAARAQRYEVEGSLRLAVNGANHSRCNFTVAVDGEKWKIKAIYKPNWYVETTCDGTNCYDLLHDPNVDIQPEETRSTTSMITAGTQPVDANWYTRLLWFAFASGHFLDQLHGNSMPGPWMEPRTDPIAHALTLSVKQSSSPSRLPLEAMFRVSAALSNKIRTNEVLFTDSLPWITRKRAIRQRLALYKDGALLGEYVVQTLTNVVGLELPLTWSLRSCDPTGAKKTNACDLLEYSCEVTRISQDVGDTSSPQISTRLFVTDTRFRSKAHSVDYIAYVVTNNMWPAATDTNLLRLLDKKTGVFPNRWLLPWAHELRTGLIAAIFGVFCVPALALLLFLRTRRKSQ
jgi:hypothetical protein